jgi:general secretion pathway protein D
VNAEDVQQFLAQLISPDGLINAYTGTNSLILIDNDDNIDRLVRIIDELDVPAKNRDLTIIPVHFADVKDLADKLNDILGSGDKKEGSGSDLLRGRVGEINQGIGAPTGLANPAAAPGQPPGFARPVGLNTGKTVAARSIEPKIIPDDRTNSIIVVADDDTTARVRALISQLDSKVDLSGNKFYVYRCQHANAEELAQVMSSLAGGGGATRGTGTGRLGGGGLGGVFGDEPGSSGRSGSNSATGSTRNRALSTFGTTGTSSSNSNPSSRSKKSTGQPTSAQLGEDISITADPATNSLIIAASKADYEKLKGLLAQLDVKRRQVLVEATLLEVSVDNNLRTSTGFLTSTGGADGGVLANSDFAGENASLSTLFKDPTKLQGFTLAAASAGSLKLPGGVTLPTQTLLVSAAQSNNNVNVLSAPTILATDNEEAQIVVGQNVPFLASTSTNETNLNNTFNQIERQDVGITLKITPQISSRDYVTLGIFTEVSAVVLSTLNSPLGPTTTKRQSETTVIAKDGQMIVTGGLISDDVSETDDGVPFLKDIPVLGHAFKSNSQARSQKNLLIFLMPRIVKDQYDARDATIEGREKMEDVIASYQVEPRRGNVLRNDRIDSVAETSDYSGPKPGTIRPAKKAASRTAQPSTNDGAVVLDGSRDGVLDLGSEPALPKQDTSASDTSDDIIIDGSADSATMASLNQEPVKAAAAGDQFLVLELVNRSDASKEIPFLLGNKSQIVGIILPRESSDNARTFFKAGNQYTYSWNNERIVTRVIGAFSSIPEAHGYYPNLPDSWYTLSPYEIMNLGKGPWTAGK